MVFNYTIPDMRDKVLNFWDRRSTKTKFVLFLIYSIILIAI
jgi:hypothetical protein